MFSQEGIIGRHGDDPARAARRFEVAVEVIDGEDLDVDGRRRGGRGRAVWEIRTGNPGLLELWSSGASAEQVDADREGS
jgi:hypothetical protein